MAMFGSDAWIVKPSCNRVSRSRFSVFPKQCQTFESMDDCRDSFCNSRCFRWLDTDQTDTCFIDIVGECPDSIAASADTSDYGSRKLSFFLHNLLFRLFADDRLEMFHHRRIRMRAYSRAEQIEGSFIVFDQIGERSIDRFF